MLKRIIIWFLRIKYRKGFGVQSPFAYHFICNVINNPCKYYAYATLKACYPQSRQEIKINKLLFRLSNYFQPSVINLVSKSAEPQPSINSTTTAYLQAGCNNAKIEHTAIINQPTKTKTLYIIYDHKTNNMTIGHLTDIDITHSVVFNLYYATIVINNSKYRPASYKVNF
ncbi:MAG: hypothetical protein KBT27_11825 [Prevotellaceae bacterium]|nr:hypothetical protein [Candidatus Faecinaster equi]